LRKTQAGGGKENNGKDQALHGFLLKSGREV
jgi:hypothetical protein